MHSGELRHLVTIEQVTAEAASADGQAVKTWGTFAELWAAIKPLRGREFFASNEYHAEVTTRIVLRHLDGVTAKMRVNYKVANGGNGQVYNIEAVLPIEERERELHLMCSKGVDDG